MLSILIPAYNYVEGVSRIVIPLLAEGRSDIEILIYDDSSNDDIEIEMRKFARSCAYLRYIRNSPALGGVRNWNKLLKNAQGRYVILNHHDDFSLSETFASDLLGELNRHDWPDALVLSNLIYDVTTKKNRLGICNPLRFMIGRYFPAYLFRRNIIGPPSVFVVRRDLFGGYDDTLQWLVDVEAYFKFLTKQTRRLFFSRMIMVTSFGLPNGISTTIRGRESEIANAELAYLETKYQQRSCWIKYLGANLWGNFILVLEYSLWILFRLISLPCNQLMFPLSFSSLLTRRISYLDPLVTSGKVKGEGSVT
jgi:glycosyltransferase involved in cell wall biosynthesis